MNGIRRILLAPLVFVVPVLAAAAEPAPDPVQVEFFEKKVRPLLVEHCYKCHSADAKKLKGGLRADSRAALLAGGDTGSALVPGDPAKSRLIEAVRYQDIDLRMPPKGKLSDAAIADLTAWVKAGAVWPADSTVQTGKLKDEFDLAKRKADHWAWQPVRVPPVPAVKNAAWPLDSVDRFLLARLEEKGLKPAATADARTLLRRVTFDLTGLPPTPEEIDKFLKDFGARPQAALEGAVDRLLASPRFGERWARHWLDLVRYGESRGHEFDYTAPNAYQYRDYVIRALNADVPYDRFVHEHVAGDLLPAPRLHPTERFNESILGTGFWFLGEEVHSPVDIRQDQADRFDNRIDVLTKTFLGLTVSCARCHDHKFDAISTKDYYALFGFLESSGYRLARFDTMEPERQLAAELAALREKHRPAVQRAVAEALRPTVARMGDYLTAAAATLVKDGPSVAKLAEQQQLDADLLGHWARHLAAAVKDETDPLHPLALAALARKPADVLVPLTQRWHKQQEDAAALLDKAEVVVDYGALQAGQWRPDGVAFGSGPVRPGDVRFGREAGQPLLRVFDRAAAVKDPTLDVLKPKGGTESDPGPAGGVVRAGRSLRTPTFTLKGGKVFSLVRGTGRVYAAVGQHVVINGPLHGALLRPIKTDGRFQWVVHDLGRYPGVPAFLEFTPADGADFAVAMVVQAAAEPGPANPPNPALLTLLANDRAQVADLATAYRGLFLGAVERLAADQLGGDADGQAALVDWLLQRPELAETIARQRLTAAAEPLIAEQARLLAQVRPDSRLALAMMDANGVNTPVFLRGMPKTLGEIVPRRFLEALAGAAPLNVPGSGRLELAQQMTDPRTNPFIARVLVNRVWHHLFGRGIVASVDNFGVLGERPTHPELLDFLADRFVKEGWSIKKLIRELVLTRAYQMASTPEAMADAADPGDLLLHRQRIRRLEGEAIRDSLLAISGRLDEKMYGPSVPVYLTEFQEGRGRPAPGPLDGAGRRSIYLSVRRNFLSSFLLAFDTPIPFSTVGRRTVSNVPAQALILMNDPFVHQQADLWAKRVLSGGGTVDRRIDGMYLSAFGRPPTDAERAACQTFLKAANGGRPEADDLAAWKDLAHALINVKEFIFVN